MNPEDWEARYRSAEQLFSGNPNGVLVAEVADLAPGRALDVGCGEGGDAVWLAARGWRVTAIDVAQTALDRGARAAKEADVADRVTWTRADLAVTAPPPGAFELVNVQYFPLERAAGDAPLHALLAAVATGGTLLFVGHDVADLAPRDGFDPSAYYHPVDVVACLDDRWAIASNGRRARTVPPPPGTGHTHDVVLRAQRVR